MTETTTPVPFNGRILRMGDHGLDVAAVHIGLRRAGATVPVGRWFTRRVRSQLMLFQHTEKLHVDGVYGPTTHQHLSKHFNRYARTLYRLSTTTQPVTKLSRVQAAQQLEHYYHEGRFHPDRISDLHQIVLTADGKAVPNWYGQQVYLDTKMLQALVFLIRTHRVGTFAICSDHFFDGMHGHAGGHACDISWIDGVEVTSPFARIKVLAVTKTLRNGMPKGLRPWQLICDGFANQHDNEISAQTILGAWEYGAATMAQHRNHVHYGFY